MSCLYLPACTARPCRVAECPCVPDTTASSLYRAAPPAGAVGSMGRGFRNGWPGQNRHTPSWERLFVEVGSPGRRVGPPVCAGDSWKEKPLGTYAAWGRLPGLWGSKSCVRSPGTGTQPSSERWFVLPQRDTEWLSQKSRCAW